MEAAKNKANLKTKEKPKRNEIAEVKSKRKKK